MKNTNSFSVAAVVAMADNRVIGNNNQLPWHMPADLRHFKHLTTGNVVIMGRKTHDSIGRALPNRVNIVVSRRHESKTSGCLYATSIDEALVLGNAQAKPLFIIGGAEIYRQALPMITHLYLTVIHHHFTGDTHFPRLDEKDWKTIAQEHHNKDAENAYDYSFLTLERIHPAMPNKAP